MYLDRTTENYGVCPAEKRGNVGNRGRDGVGGNRQQYLNLQRKTPTTIFYYVCWTSNKDFKSKRLNKYCHKAKSVCYDLCSTTCIGYGNLILSL